MKISYGDTINKVEKLAIKIIFIYSAIFINYIENIIGNFYTFISEKLLIYVNSVPCIIFFPIYS